MRIIATVPTLGIEITSEDRWINTERTYISKMDYDHLRNATMWAYRKWQDEKGAKMPEETKFGRTYREWYLILKAVFDNYDNISIIENSKNNNNKHHNSSHHDIECYGSSHHDMAMESAMMHNGF